MHVSSAFSNKMHKTQRQMVHSATTDGIYNFYIWVFETNAIHWRVCYVPFQSCWREIEMCAERAMGANMSVGSAYALSTIKIESEVSLGPSQSDIRQHFIHGPGTRAPASEHRVKSAPNIPDIQFSRRHFTNFELTFVIHEVHTWSWVRLATHTKVGHGIPI